MTTRDELKPCPFCGANARLDIDIDEALEAAKAALSTPSDAGNASAEARLREALEAARDYIGHDNNPKSSRVMEKIMKALSAGGDEAKKSEGGVEGRAQCLTTARQNDSGFRSCRSSVEAGIKPGPSAPSADRREIVAQALCHLRNVAKNKETWTPECERVYQGAQKAIAALGKVRP